MRSSPARGAASGARSRPASRGRARTSPSTTARRRIARSRQERGGAIVNVCSNVVVTGSPRAPQYAASKYGVLGLTKSYAHAFAPRVRVNALGPGFMETESTVNREDWRSGRREAILEQTPLGRIPKPEELVGAIVFLASDDAAHMTGNFVLCDGGFSMVGA